MLSPLPNEVYCMQEPGRLREKGAGVQYCLASLQHPDIRTPSVLIPTTHIGLFLTFGSVYVSSATPQAQRPHTLHEGSDVIAKIQYKG